MNDSPRIRLSLLIRPALLGAIAGAIAVGVVGRGDPSGRFAGVLGGSFGSALGVLAYLVITQLLPGRVGPWLGSGVAGILAGLVLGLFVPELRAIAPLGGLIFGLMINWAGIFVGGLVASLISGILIGAIATTATADSAGDFIGGAFGGLLINALFGVVGVFVVWLVDKLYGVILTYMGRPPADFD